MWGRLFTFLVALLVFGLCACLWPPEVATARSKTDVVVLVNGDRITCEILELVRGKLRVKTDSAGTIEIEWQDIVALSSGYYFRVEDTSRARYFGGITIVEGQSTFRVASFQAIVTLEKRNVVGITPIEQSFWSRFDGSLKIGYDFTRATDVKKSYIDWRNRFRTERNYIDTHLGLTHNDKGAEQGTSRRYEFKTDYTRLLRGKWTGTTSLTVERNDELKLRRRVLFSVGSGGSVLKSNRHDLLLSTGLALNSELAVDSTKATESLEVVLSAGYSRFIYDTPKTTIDTSLDVYPSLTEKDRIRVNLEITLSREIVKDLTFALDYYLKYDNKGASGEGESRDYGIGTSLGWTY